MELDGSENGTTAVVVGQFGDGATTADTAAHRIDFAIAIPAEAADGAAGESKSLNLDEVDLEDMLDL